VTQLEIHPVTPDRWNDLVDLFGPNGAYSGCWCMWPRQSSADFDLHHGEDNRRSLRAIVADRVAGLLAYEDGSPVGWVAVGPREEYGRIQRSRVTKPVDDVAVWSIVCFYITSGRRGEGIGSALLDAAVEYAGSRGATAVEGYPLDKEKASNSDAWWGLAGMFLDAGFQEIARRSPTRPLMRKML
jgi:GNAT superfamily N-acetyltransferase